MLFESYYSGSDANLYSITTRDSTLLIEAGIRIKKLRKAIGFNLSSIDAALITHSHMDHARSVSHLLKFGIDCYMSKEIADKLGVAASHRVLICEPLKAFDILHWTILPFETEHDCAGSLGFLISDGIDKLLFATDTFYLKYKFSGLSLIAIECNWSEQTLAPGIDPSLKSRLLTSHFSLKNVIKFFEANDLSRLRATYLLHLSDGNSDAEMFQNEIMKITGKPVYVC